MNTILFFIVRNFFSSLLFIIEHFYYRNFFRDVLSSIKTFYSTIHTFRKIFIYSFVFLTSSLTARGLSDLAVYIILQEMRHVDGFKRTDDPGELFEVVLKSLFCVVGYLDKRTSD